MQMLDCYDSKKRYMGLFMVGNTEELMLKHPAVKYIACANIETGEKIICAISKDGIFTGAEGVVPEPLSGITSYKLPDDAKISEPKISEISPQEHFRDFAKKENKEDIIQLDALNEIQIRLRAQIKEKETEKKSLLAEARKLRQEIKELQQQLAEL